MSSDAILLAAVAGGSGAGAAIDLRTRRVPNWLTLTITGVGINLAAAHLTGVSVAGALGGFAVGLLLMLPACRRHGRGDVELFAAVGTLLEPTRWRGVHRTAILGGVIACLSRCIADDCSPRFRKQRPRHDRRRECRPD
jgi:Flp pilus assembly protein protease CpaA